MGVAYASAVGIDGGLCCHTSGGTPKGLSGRSLSGLLGLQFEITLAVLQGIEQVFSLGAAFPILFAIFFGTFFVMTEWVAADATVRDCAGDLLGGLHTSSLLSTSAPVLRSAGNSSALVQLPSGRLGQPVRVALSRAASSPRRLRRACAGRRAMPRSSA